MVNRIWPTAMAGKADSVSSVSASAYHTGGRNSVNPGQILLVHGRSQVIYIFNIVPQRLEGLFVSFNQHYGNPAGRVQLRLMPYSLAQIGKLCVVALT